MKQVLGNGKRTVILVTAFTNFVVRNLLNTDFFRILKEQNDLTIVLLASIDKKDYLKENFASSNVIVEGAEIPILSKPKLIINRFSRMLLNTRTVKLFMRLRLDLKTPRGLFEYCLARLVAIFFGPFPLFKTFLRMADYYLLPKNRFKEYFDRYNPVLVFSTDITDLSTGESDIDLLREAKAREIPAIGMIRSWDNLTARGIIREVPQKIIVHNEILKKHCVHYHNIEEEKIFPVGIPHYDNYLKCTKMPKLEFFQKTGLDPKKKMILFVPTADEFLRKQLRNKNVSINRYILDLLMQLDRNKVQILVRFPLTGSVDFGNFVPPSNVIFDYPEVLFGKGELNIEADGHLINSLYHSDLVLPGPSTIAMDSLLFGKPIILISFDKAKNLPYYESVKKFMDLEHLRPLIDLGGAEVVNNEREFLSLLNKYLENSEFNRQKREETIRVLGWRLDGMSGERLAEFVLREIKGAI